MLTHQLSAVTTKPVSPAVGTVMRGEGKVIHHDVTLYGLHRMCVEMAGKYPDLETWCELLKDRKLKLHDYSKRIVSNVFIGYLWLYWKEG